MIDELDVMPIFFISGGKLTPGVWVGAKYFFALESEQWGAENKITPPLHGSAGFHKPEKNMHIRFGE